MQSANDDEDHYEPEESTDELLDRFSGSNELRRAEGEAKEDAKEVEVFAQGRLDPDPVILASTSDAETLYVNVWAKKTWYWLGVDVKARAWVSTDRAGRKKRAVPELRLYLDWMSDVDPLEPRKRTRKNKSEVTLSYSAKEFPGPVPDVALEAKGCMITREGGSLTCSKVKIDKLSIF